MTVPIIIVRENHERRGELIERLGRNSGNVMGIFEHSWSNKKKKKVITPPWDAQK